MQLQHRFRRIVLIICCVGLLQLASGLLFAEHIPTALASSFVIGSDPIDGSTINTVPSVVRIYFNAPLSGISQAGVYAFPANAPTSGLAVAASASSVNASNSRELDIPLLPASKLPQGGYEVRWTAVSLTDGRTTSGLIGFNYGQSSTGLAGTPTLGPGTSNYFPQLDLQGILSVAWDWLVLLALLFWVGILVTDALIIPRNAPGTFLLRLRKQSRTLQVFCLIAALVGELINLVLRSTSLTQTLGGSGLDLNALTLFILRTSYGYLWLVRACLLLIALFFLWREGYRKHQNQHANHPLQTHAHWNQNRQSTRQEISPDAPATPSIRTQQIRVTGAMVTNATANRGTTAALPRITTTIVVETEASIRATSLWSQPGRLLLVGLVILTLTLSQEIKQLVPLPVSASVFLWLSLVTLGIWGGSATYFGLSILPILQLTEPDHHTEHLVIVLKRAIPLWLSAIGILLVSDLFINEATIQQAAQFITTSYGLALLMRDSLVVLTACFTGYILFLLLPHLQRQTVLLPVVDAELPAKRARKHELEKTQYITRRMLHIVTALVASMLVCTALMNFFAPPLVFPNVNYAAEIATENSGTNQFPAPQVQQVAGLQITLQALPARVGVDNTLILNLRDIQGGAITDATVKVQINMDIMNMGTASATLSDASATYSTLFKASQTFTMAGAWTVQVTILRPHQTTVQTLFKINVTQ